ncbi:MAG: hypothetical protein IJM83_12660 [Firmicutes bacterium]|nr:hypothetical protein [Lachnospiraceae bacterium]MBQ7060129.1 hypothetical protein [Bacillota bacterium]
MKESNKKTVTLFSGFFPFYGIITGNFDNVWWMALLNLAILFAASFLVLWIGRERSFQKVMKVTGRAYLAAILADAAGLLFRFLPLLAELVLRLFGAVKPAEYLAKYVSPFTWYEIWAWWNKIGLPWTIASILVAGVAAYLFNYCWLLKKLVPDRKLRRILSIVLAVLSAPYAWTNPAW